MNDVRTGFFDATPDIPGFVVEEEIGRGSQARVFRARQEAMDRVVALKVIPGPTSDDGLRRTLRLFREARVLGALDHPGIVRGIDAGSTPDCSWFAMEYVEGRTLGRILSEDGPPPVARAVAIALDLLDALDHTHRRGIVHRDIKPSNILVDRSGRARLLDLGLARRDADPRQSLDGGALGTPKYMAPEQARSPDVVDGRADLFALAGVLYAAIAGQAPFEGRTVAEVLTRVLYDQPTSLASLRLDVPDALSAVIEKALAKNPDHRFQDASAFAAALRAAMRPGSTPRSVVGGSRDGGGGRRAAIALSAVALVGLVAIGFRVFADDASKPRPPGGGGVRPAAGKPAVEVETVLSLRPESTPDLSSAERARRALAAAADGPFDPADLEACLAPLRADLESTADQLRRSALKVAREGDAETARRMARGARAALLRETAPDGEEPPAAARRAAEEIAALVEPRFEEEWRVIQEDLAVDCVRRLEALLDRAEAAQWTPEDQAKAVREALGRVGPTLEGAVRKQLLQKRDAVERALAEKPRLDFERRFDEAEALLAAGRLVAARERLNPYLRGEGEALVRGSSSRAKVLADAVDDAERRLFEKSSAAPDALARGDVLSLDAAERTERAAALRSVATAAREGGGDVRALADMAPFLESLADVADEAASMRATCLARAGAGPPAGDAGFRLATRRDGPLSERRVVGRDGGRLVVKNPVDGADHRHDVESLTAGCVADVLALYGARPREAAIALLDHWDGDDASAEARLRLVDASDPAVARLSGIVSAAVETVAAKMPTESDRRALKVLLDARRRRAEGDVAGAADRVRPLGADAKIRGGAFWKRYGDEVERMLVRARAAEEREARLRPFGATPRTFDAKARRVSLEYEFKRDAVCEGFEPPEGATRDDVGLRWPDVRGAATLFPEQAPALRIPVAPESAAGPASVRVEIVVDPKNPPSFVAVSWCDATFLTFGSLRDFGAFAGVPLHGLERDLISAKDVDRALCLYGGVADVRRRLAADGAPVKSWSRQGKLTVALETGEDGSTTAIVDDARYPARGARPRPAGRPGLEVRLPPGVVLKSATISFPIPPEEPR